MGDDRMGDERMERGAASVSSGSNVGPRVNDPYAEFYPLRAAPSTSRRRPAARRGHVAVAAAVRAGSVLAVAAAAHQLVNVRSLRVPPQDPPEVVEKVSVLIPARNEASRIGPTVRSVLAQRRVPRLEVLVLDDGSTDGTADVVRAAAGDDPRLSILTGTSPPAGVLGKPHACAQLVAAADGRLLVLVDADVVLAPRAVAAAVSTLRDAGLDLLCPWPRQVADGVGPRLLQPLLAWSWMVTLPLRRAERSSRPSMVAANGQFMVLDAGALAAAGGIATTFTEVLDDIALARAVKRSGGRVGVADGSAIASCRMYEGWADLSAGYRKSLWTAFGAAPVSASVAALLALTYLVPPVAALGGSRAGLVGYAAAVASRVVAARRTRGRAWPDALAHPVSIAALLSLWARSWAGHRRGTLTWKGRVL